MITVQSVLQQKPESFNVISPDTLVIDALNLLNSVNLSYLVVMQEEEYRGIFSERDYSRKLVLNGRSSKDTYIKEIMTTDIPVVSLADTVEYCMKLLNQHKTRYLLAFNGEEKFAGVITINDLLRQVISNREQVFDGSLAQQLLEYDERSRIY